MRGRLMIAVFVAGFTTLGIELSASRLLGNVFGTSNIVWANIIGLMLVYLSLGYFLGGRLADRRPERRVFFRLLAWGAFAAGLVPMAARPVLRQAAQAVENLDAGVMVGSLVTVLILLVIPVTLLGMISPFAIRLAVRTPEEAGRVSGRIYAISTLGSILGTFIPVLWLIPSLGTSATFLSLSLTLLAAALWGMAGEDRREALRHVWMPPALLVLAWLVLRGPLKASEGQIFETESAYNYIQVLERDGIRYLMLNEGQGIHSVYSPDRILTGGTWDFFLAAPFFNDVPHPMEAVHRVGLVGLAGGTIAQQYTAAFGPLPIDGWEIDPGILEVGRTYFGMTEPNLHAIAQDGRWGLAHSRQAYSVIGVDAYRLPYIPWHLTTREFFTEVLDHLEPDGVVVINVGRTADDRRIVEAMVGTMAAVFPSVHVVDVPATFNTILYATRQPTNSDNLAENWVRLEQGGAPSILLEAVAAAVENLQPTPESSIVFTDDLAPIEQLTNSLALRFLLSGDLARLP
ncbi:MAG: fused MFS/spermidine synthase [Anaerolineales bacterium]